MAVRVGLEFLLPKGEATTFGRSRGGSSKEASGRWRTRVVAEGKAAGALDRIMEK